MSTTTYEVGDIARLSVTFTDINGTPTDPTTVSLLIQTPDNNQTTVSSGSITRVSAGLYYYDYTITQAGTPTVPDHLYRYTGTGAITAVIESRFTVVPTILIPQPPGASAEWTAADLVAIDKSLKSGALSVRYQDRTVTYRSLDELLRIRSIILTALGGTSAPVIRQSRVFSSQGW